MFNKEQLKNISAVWIVPIIALLIGAVLLFDHYTKIGKTIFIVAKNADGITSGKTEIKVRSVSVGKIVKVSLSDDLNSVILTATMNKDANKLLVEDSKFWLIKPRVNTQGVSGLDTLITGMYIDLYPGKSSNEKDNFELIDETVLIGNQTEGKYIQLLDTTSESKIQPGQPISYHGYEVGTIVSSKLSIESRRMEYVGFIYSPYDNLVTTNSKFWMTSAVDLNFGNKGFSLKIGTFDNFLKGGVTFDVPRGKSLGNPIKNNAVFNIYKSENSVEEPDYKNNVDFVVMLPKYVNDLEEGTPVEFAGMQVGVVKEKKLRDNYLFNALDESNIPVVISIQKERFDPDNEISMDKFKETLLSFLQKGIKASIEKSGFLPGNTFVVIYEDPSSESSHMNTYHNMYVIPGSISEIDSIPKKLGKLVDNINSIDFNKIGTNLNKSLESLDDTLKELKTLSGNLARMTNNEEQQKLLGNINKSLLQLQKTLDSYSENSSMYYEISSTLKSINNLIDSLNPIIQKTDENPNRYIFNNDPDDEQPKSGNDHDR